MKTFADYDIPSLADRLQQWGYRPSHAGRLLGRFYRYPGKPIDSGRLLIPQALHKRLQDEIPDRQSRVAARTEAADGTVKLLVEFDAGGAVESVLMPGYRKDRAAGCVSSQIGCAMGCDFCATTQAGLVRNLTAGEIAEQFLHLKELAISMGRQLQTVVFMGMGEPLLNLDNVVGGIRRIADPLLGAVGWRNTNVSTVGIVPGIHRLIDADLNVNLTISLHAPDDETRAKIIPTACKYPVADIIAAARRFLTETTLFPNIAYCLLDGVNDSDEHADRLAALMEGFRAHVNLIPYNHIGPGISGTVYRPSPPERLQRFLRILHDRKVVAHGRDSRGGDANAACGQLRASHLQSHGDPT
jgi:23S rRNA (adenine2503-C2)-methyltransferase